MEILVQHKTLQVITRECTLVEVDESDTPLPPNPVTGIPFKDDITDNKVGSTR